MSHNQEIFGFSLCYADFPGIEIDAVKHAFEINSRILLQQKDAFIENDYLNMSLHYKGIESFQLSRIACGVSKTALDEMGWRINLSSRGFSIEDKTGKSIGRFEYFYGKKADSNRNICCQPVLQRWIIKKDELCKARLVLSGNPKLKMTVETVILMQPYK